MSEVRGTSRSGYVLPGLREARYLTIQERYDEWRDTASGRTVYAACRAAAVNLRKRGFTHFGIAAIWERARYELALELGPDHPDSFKLNNTYRSRMARELMNNEPDLAGFFETRELRAA